MEMLEAYLPWIWGAVIATGVFVYVILDGFDLGVGMLCKFRKNEADRGVMINSIAPFWDGNETWLVLGGGGLFAAFPLAYSVVMPALYIPIILMLVSLIFRGVAFEFRFKAEGKGREFWDKAFVFGSVFAAFAQGVVLGGFVQGITYDEATRSFAGGTLDWLSPFSILCGIAVVFGYALLGACWLIMKTEGELQDWAYGLAPKILTVMLAFMVMFTLWTPFLHSGMPLLSIHLDEVMHTALWERWFSTPNIFFLGWIPVLVAVVAFLLYRAIARRQEIAPYLYTAALFLLGYIGLAVTAWPNIVPPDITLHEAAAHPSSQFLLLIGVVVLLPVILGYTGFIYWVFRGKVTHDAGYSH